MSSWDNLTGFQLDVLKEIGNIGAGNAATSLASLINKKVGMSIPKAGILHFQEIFQLVGQEEDRVACVNFHVSGEAPSVILFIVDEESAFRLLQMLLGGEGESQGTLDPIGESTLKEVGNILTGSFLTAFSEFTQINFIPSVPAFAFDMLGAVLSTAFFERGYFEDRALIIETEFYEEDVSINGHFFLVPEVGSLDKIFQALGLNV